MADTATFSETLDHARRLPRLERARLIAQLVEELASDTPAPRQRQIPVITGGTWNDDIPLRREDLYDDTGRA